MPLSSSVELIYDATCPNVDVARQQLRDALARAGRPPVWTEWDRAAPGSPAYVRRYASPTVLVAGSDVTGPTELDAGDGCRVYQDATGAFLRAPSVQTILAAISSADPTPRGGWLAGGAAAGGLAGAMVAAVAGLCCAGPVTVVLLGVGGAVAAAGLKPYRVPLLFISAVLLAVAYWRTYRSVASSTTACPVRVSRWVRGSLVAAAMVWVAAATLAAVE